MHSEGSHIFTGLKSTSLPVLACRALTWRFFSHVSVFFFDSPICLLETHPHIETTCCIGKNSRVLRTCH